MYLSRVTTAVSINANLELHKVVDSMKEVFWKAPRIRYKIPAAITNVSWCKHDHLPHYVFGVGIFQDLAVTSLEAFLAKHNDTFDTLIAKLDFAIMISSHASVSSSLQMVPPLLTVHRLLYLGKVSHELRDVCTVVNIVG